MLREKWKAELIFLPYVVEKSLLTATTNSTQRIKIMSYRFKNKTKPKAKQKPSALMILRKVYENKICRLKLEDSGFFFNPKGLLPLQ